MSNPRQDPNESRPPFQRMAHDVKNYLAVISLGMEALKGVRDDDEQFAKVMDMIRQEGVEPLKKTISAFVNLAGQNP